MQTSVRAGSEAQAVAIFTLERNEIRSEGIGGDGGLGPVLVGRGCLLFPRFFSAVFLVGMGQGVGWFCRRVRGISIH